LANKAAVAEVTEVESAIDFFLSSVMAKNLKRKRDQDAVVEDEEVRVGPMSYG